MNRKFIEASVIAGLILAVGGSAQAQDSWKDFSADTVSTFGTQSIEGKVFITKDKSRMETPQNIVITRLDKQVAWILMPAQNLYMEHVLAPSMIPKVSKEMPGEVERVLIGPESVNGVPAKKYKITYVQNTREDSVYQWLGHSEIPLKIEAVDGNWSMEYKNMQEGPQDDSLFEIPAGWQKFAMPAMPSHMQAMANGEAGGSE